MTQNLSDNRIIDTIGTDTEAGYRMLLQKYKVPVGT